jgi:hypothetical protein
MKTERFVQAAILLILLQVILYFVCEQMLVPRLTLIRWNVSFIAISLVISQILIICHNLKMGCIHPFFTRNTAGWIAFGGMSVIVLGLIALLIWFAALCLTHPELIKFK